MEPKSAAPPPPPRRRLLHLTGMFRSLQLPECDAPTGANTHVAPSARTGEDDDGPSAAEPGRSRSARSPRLDADGFEFTDAAPAAADARNTEARAETAAERDGASGGPSVVSGWDSVGSDFIRSVIRARTTGAAAMSRARNGKSDGDGDGNGDGDEGTGDGGYSNGDGSDNVKAEADGADPRAFPGQPTQSESSRRGRSRSRSRSGSRSRSRNSNSSSSSSSNSDRSHSRSPSQSAAAPPSSLAGRNGDTAVAMSALKFVRSAVKAVRSTIGNHQSETRGAADGAKSGSENESAADEDDDDSDGSGDGEEGEDEGEGKGESEESGAEEDDEVDAGAAEVEGESDEDADSDYCEDEAEAECEGEADGSSDAVTSEDDTGNGESESIKSAVDSSLSTRVTEVPPKAADGGELQGAAAADSGDESSDTTAPRAGADAQRKKDKRKPERTHGGRPVHAVASALIVAVLLVLAGVTIHRARMRAGQVYGYQRWSGGPLFSAFPRSFSEAVLRWQDGVTTPLGLTMAYIPGCVVQMKRCHEGGAYGLAQKRAASGFLERQTLLGVVSNSTATATLETCADAARVWHRRCDNTANEHVHTRFVDRNGTQTLCVYPPRGVRFELPKYLDAAGVCETPSECQRIAECFERKGWGGERWTRERLSNAQLSACLPAFGQRLSWFTAGRAGAFQHPTEWRQRVDCERLPAYTLAREAEVTRRIAHDSIVAASA